MERKESQISLTKSLKADEHHSSYYFVKFIVILKLGICFFNKFVVSPDSQLPATIFPSTSIFKFRGCPSLKRIFLYLFYIFFFLFYEKVHEYLKCRQILQLTCCMIFSRRMKGRGDMQFVSSSNIVSAISISS